MRNREQIKTEIERTQNRLELYYKQEEKMLSDAAQSYSIGSRSIQRYNTSLSAVQSKIKELEKKLSELKSELSGKGARRAVSVVPRDW